MSKCINSGGLFSDAIYDKRMVYSHADACKLANEGFTIPYGTDIGIFLLNEFYAEE